jgi:GNAT superfamily N-acetyltransferase
MSGVEVRAAQVEDADRVFAAWQALRGYYASVDRRINPAPIGRDEFIAAYQQRLGRPVAASFVAVDGKRLAGFISGAIEQNQPDRLPESYVAVGQLYVAEAYRRQGLGQRLFQAIADWASQQNGVSHLEMPVLAADTEAMNFWQSIGFTPFIQRLWAPLSAPEPND